MSGRSASVSPSVASWFTRLDEPQKTIFSKIVSGLFAILLGIPILGYFAYTFKKNKKTPETQQKFIVCCSVC